ncbi:MAG: hypothetical protein P1S60_20520 [Anaerolineae bacterium]|nr:hypothetical protein [Anaerolineae bacterium]
MADQLSLRIISPEKTIVDAESITKVRIHLSDGSWLSVYPGHAPLLAEILPGKLFYEQGNIVEERQLSAGIFQVVHNSVTVFVNSEMQMQNLDSISENMAQFDLLSRELLLTLDAHFLDNSDS